MKFAEGRQGRVFVLRLEDGDSLHEEIEGFAKKKGVSAASLVMVGGAEPGSRLVVGPENGSERPISPMVRELAGVHEVTGTGTLFPDEKGDPRLHMHVSAGRGESTTTGCTRAGLVAWQTLEVVLSEIVDVEAVRRMDHEIGFAKLEP